MSQFNINFLIYLFMIGICNDNQYKVDQIKGAKKYYASKIDHVQWSLGSKDLSRGDSKEKENILKAKNYKKMIYIF